MIPALISLLLLALLATAASRIAYVYSFQPFGYGSGGLGPVPSGDSVKIANDGLANTQYLLVGAPGTVGTIEYPIGNLSDRDVRVLGLGRDPFVTSLAWSTLRDPYSPRPFPMTLKAHESLTLWVTVTKPSYCGEGRYDALVSIPIRYEALGVVHTYMLALHPGSPLADGYIPIALCVDPHQTAHVR
jgi:hypothetical protein